MFRTTPTKLCQHTTLSARVSLRTFRWQSIPKFKKWTTMTTYNGMHTAAMRPNLQTLQSWLTDKLKNTLLTSYWHFAGVSSCTFDTANNTWVVFLPPCFPAFDFLLESQRTVILAARTFDFAFETVFSFVFTVVVRIAWRAVWAEKFRTFFIITLFKVLRLFALLVTGQQLSHILFILQRSLAGFSVVLNKPKVFKSNFCRFSRSWYCRRSLRLLGSGYGRCTCCDIILHLRRCASKLSITENLP